MRCERRRSMPCRLPSENKYGRSFPTDCQGFGSWQAVAGGCTSGAISTSSPPWCAAKVCGDTVRIRYSVCRPPRTPWSRRVGSCARRRAPHARRSRSTCALPHSSGSRGQWHATAPVIHRIKWNIPNILVCALSYFLLGRTF